MTLSHSEADITSWVQRITSGQRRAVAKLIRALEARSPLGTEVLKALFPYTGDAHVIGITGPPGSGKSSLTDRLIQHYRQKGHRVGVVAVDPSSPFTGGAILGDRIRMQQHSTDRDVFIRSLASRGALGGLSYAASQVIRALDAFGCHKILVETVGVGQAEVDIMYHADSVLIVAPPGLGDDVQAIKSGLLETGDIYIVNKADLPGARHTLRDLKMMLRLRPSRQGEWKPPVLSTVATQNQGFEALLDALDAHRHYEAPHLQTPRQQKRRERELLSLLQGTAIEHFSHYLQSQGPLLQTVTERGQDPHQVAQEIFQNYLDHMRNSHEQS